MNASDRCYETQSASREGLIMKRNFFVIATVLMLAATGLPFTSWAQDHAPVQGILTAVDFAGNTLTITSPAGTRTFIVTPQTALFTSGRDRVAFSTVTAFVGTVATIWFDAAGTQLVAGRVE